MVQTRLGLFVECVPTAVGVPEPDLDATSGARFGSVRGDVDNGMLSTAARRAESMAVSWARDEYEALIRRVDRRRVAK